MGGFTAGLPGVGSAVIRVISGVIPPGAKKTSVCPHSDGRHVHVTLVFSCPETSPLRVWHRSALPRHRFLTCTLTKLKPTVYEKPFLVWLFPQQFCTSMSSVPDPVPRDLNVLWGEAHLTLPQSLWGHLCPMLCNMVKTPEGDPGTVASSIQVTELLHVSSTLGSTPSSIIKASGVLWCIT